MEAFRLCGSDLAKVGRRGEAAVCASLPLYTFPNPNVEDPDLAKRNKTLLRDWQVKIRKDNLVLSHRNDARLCGAHWPQLRRVSLSQLPSLFAWSKQARKRRPVVRHALPPTNSATTTSSRPSSPVLDSCVAVLDRQALDNEERKTNFSSCW